MPGSQKDKKRKMKEEQNSSKVTSDGVGGVGLVTVGGGTTTKTVFFVCFSMITCRKH